MSNSIADKAKSNFTTDLGTINYYSLEKICKKYKINLQDLPFTIRIILENIVRNMDGEVVTENDLNTVLSWSPSKLPEQEIPYMPSRVLSQDFTGVPAVVDLASMRSAVERMGGNPKIVNPIVPLDLVIDHSVQIDFFGTNTSFALNAEKEFERNHERYSLLKWAQNAFENTRVIPPGVGICHQVNLEFLSNVVSTKTVDGEIIAFPDTAVGMDSHTTMVDGLGVLAWGVGGIEAEVVLVGQPYYMLMQEVIGVKLTGELQTGVTATDLVLTITEMLRKEGVVGKFVEFYGEGIDKLPLADKATISNMCPEYGATAALFPVNNETIKYLELTGRSKEQIELVTKYTKKQSLFYSPGDPDPKYTKSLLLDLSTVEPSLAGPRRPQDKVTVNGLKERFHTSMKELYGKETTDPKTDFGVKSSVEGVKIDIDGDGISNADLIIEAIFENTQAKKDLYKTGKLSHTLSTTLNLSQSDQTLLKQSEKSNTLTHSLTKINEHLIAKETQHQLTKISLLSPILIILLSIIITFLMGSQMYNANIQQNKVYGIILKEAKLFDDNINYQSSGNVDRGNKVLILDESEDMFLITLLDGQNGWVEKNRIKTLEIY